MQNDLNRLKYFYFIYQEEGVSKAAAKLNTSQPAVSQQLQKLEKELGVLLFTRLHKKLIPTSAGHQLYEVLGDFFHELPEQLLHLKIPSKTPSGIIIIGAPYEFGKEYLPEICHEYRQKFPDVRFTIRLGEPIPMLDFLKNGEIDFAVIDIVLATTYLGKHTDFYSVDPLIDEELALICSADYYHANIAGDHSYSNLITKDFISDEHDNMFLKHWFQYHYAKSSVEPNVVMTVESHQANLACVKLGMGLTVTSSHMVWEDIEQEKIVAINTDVQNAMNTISLVQLQDKVPTVTEKSFHTYLKKSMQHENMLKKFRI